MRIKCNYFIFKYIGNDDGGVFGVNQDMILDTPQTKMTVPASDGKKTTMPMPGPSAIPITCTTSKSNPENAQPLASHVTRNSSTAEKETNTADKNTTSDVGHANVDKGENAEKEENKPVKKPKRSRPARKAAKK